MIEVVYTLNKDCNWNCSYCNQKLLDKSISKTDDELIKSFEEWVVKTIKYYGDIILYLCGGEPGLWSSYLWEGLGKTIEKYNNNIIYIRIFTNGTAINNDKIFNHPSFGKYYNRKILYLWHCTPYIKDTIVKLPFNETSGYIIGQNVMPMIVLLKEEIKYLEDFINNNKHLGKIKIDLAQSSTYTDIGPDYTLEEYEQVCDILIKYEDRFTQDTFMSIMTTKNRLKHKGVKNIQSICKLQNYSVLIDLSENVINRCCNFSSTAELNDSNFELKCNGNLFKDADCGNCVNKVAFYGVKEKNGS